jgi:hypothetical protein
LNKHEFLARPWQYPAFDYRAVDEDGTEYYFTRTPEIVGGAWIQEYLRGKKFWRVEVSELWRESLQSKEDYKLLIN